MQSKSKDITEVLRFVYKQIKKLLFRLQEKSVDIHPDHVTDKLSE